jgi:hypothetical protein
MQIIDKYGYLENALSYIDKQIISGRGLLKISKKAGIEEGPLKNLSLALKDFSEKKLFSVLQEKIDDWDSSTTTAEVEISQVDMGVESQKGKVFILMNLICNIEADGEEKDKIRMDIKIFSKNNIR